MATFSHKRVGGPEGYVGTYKANGVILMGALVMTNTTANEVLETSASTSQPIGVALYDEQIARINAAEQYADDDPMRVEHLSVGQVWNLAGTGSITKGALLCAGADGIVQPVSGTGDFAQFRALEAIDNGSRGKVAVIAGRFTTTAAGE